MRGHIKPTQDQIEPNTEKLVVSNICKFKILVQVVQDGWQYGQVED